MDDRTFEQIVMTLLARPVAFYPVFARVAGTTDAGIMLSQAWYWTQRLPEDRDGWFYKSWTDWQEETSLGRRQQDTAKKQLKSVGLIETRREGLDPVLHYRINREKLISLLKFLCTDSCIGMHKTEHANAPKRAQGCTEMGTVHVAEITTEITTEISSAGADGAAPGGKPSDLPQDASKPASPAQGKAKGEKKRQANPNSKPDGTSEPWTHPFCAVFAERFKSRWDGWEYKFSGRDFKAFKEIRATQGEAFTLPAFLRAVTHYFQSPPKPKHTIWHLLDSFAVYYQGPLNKFNQLETEDRNAAIASYTAGPASNRPQRQTHGERAGNNTFAVLAASVASWEAGGDFSATGNPDGPIIDHRADGATLAEAGQADDFYSAKPAA